MSKAAKKKTSRTARANTTPAQGSAADAPDAADTPTGASAAAPAFPNADEGLLAPISAEHPTGEDPRHGDRFAAIKAELEKISGADFQGIQSNARVILAEEGKDLRVIGYLALAGLAEGGLEPMSEALDTGAAMLERFGDDCHPRRPKARTNAAQWFDGERFEQLLGQAELDGDRALWDQVSESTDRLRTRLERIGLDPTDAFAVLRRWLKANKPRQPEPEPEPRQNQDSSPGNRPASAPADRATITSEIASEQDFQRGSRALIQWFMAQGNLAAAIAQARLMRWAGLISPPASDGRTRIPAPREGIARAGENAIASGDWSNALNAVEQAFLEPGGHLLFRLQRLAHQAATKAGDEAAAEMIRLQVIALLRRLPELRSLAFDDGTPFMDEADRDWFARMETADDQDGGHAETGDDPIRALEREATELAAKKGLAAGFAHLDQLAAWDGRTRARVQLARARIAMSQDRAGVAAGLCSELIDDLESNGTVTWDGRLAADVAQLALRAVSGLDEKLFPAGREPAAWRRELRQILLRAAPGRAAEIL